MGTLDGIERISRLGEELYHTDNYVGIVEGSAYHQSSPDSISSLSGRIATVKLKILGKSIFEIQSIFFLVAYLLSSNRCHW